VFFDTLFYGLRKENDLEEDDPEVEKPLFLKTQA